MKTEEIIEIFDSLPKEKQVEALDFIRFLKYRAVKERILASDKEERISFDNVDELVKAIENAD